MNRDQTYWAEVEAIFNETVDLDPAARECVLATRCAHASRLRADVERLLASDAGAPDLDDGAARRGPESAPNRPPGIGSVIGAFRLAEAIGTGGMGTVYRAQRHDDEFAQQVAIKIIETPASHSGAARRFRAERHILSSLQHPHIVTLLDGGIAASGHPYLVMEYVDGIPISNYCSERRLLLSDRLQLFRLVCSAVHHAHRHSVVHRDLKPANIVVTPEGIPKVLDFGVAKLLDTSTPLGETATGLGPGPLTPNYASPEQLRGLPVTSSSDVYALGVLLYEMVSGRRPYETEDKPLDEVIRIVVHEDPPRPSAVTASHATLPYEPSRALRGDLDAIVRRAMAKAPEERYGSAEELADDVKRFLNGVPVVAQEPSFAYLARKLAARHKVAFAATTIAVLLIVAALFVALWQARIARAERLRAEARFSEVRQLANALIFEIHDAVAPLPGSTPVRRTIVARALGYLEQLAKEAQRDATLQIELANAYIQIGTVQGDGSSANLGDADGAIVSFRRAQALVEPLANAESPAREVVDAFVEATRHLSNAVNLRKDGQKDAMREAQRAVAVADAYYQRLPHDVHARNLLARSIFTVALVARWPEWFPHWKRASELYEGLLAERPDDEQNLRNVALVQKYLGSHWEMNGDLAQALSHFERARAMDERRLAQIPNNGGARLDIAIDLANEANIYRKQRNPLAAEMYEKSLAVRKEIAASDPKNIWAQTRVGYVHGQLAMVYEQAGQRSRALDHSRTAAAIYTAHRTSDMARILEYVPILWMLAWLENAEGRRAQACEAYDRSFRAFHELDADMQARLKGDLAEAARSASACGVKVEDAWLEGGKGQ
jgi:non-specific serine/threonine protein kinase/serine/threonine-protein kinase